MRATSTKTPTIRLADVLEPFDERLGARREPEILTLTENNGFVSQRLRFNKRLAVDDTSNYKVIGLHDVAFNPYLLWAGAIAQNTEWPQAIISPLYPTFRVRKAFEPRFVDYLLRGAQLVSRYDSISFGSVPRKRRATVDDFLDLRIPKPPPLDEQRRIAAILDQADALRDLRQRACLKLRAARSSAYTQLLGDPIANETGWPVRTLGELLEDAELFVDGDWVESKDQDPDGAVRLTQLADIGDGEWLDKSHRFLTAEKARALRCTYLKQDDVLVARMPDPLGRACLFPGSPQACVTVVDVCVVRPAPSGPIGAWLAACLNMPSIRARIATFATGTTRSRISRSNLAKIKLAIPPIERQRAFVAANQRADELLRSHRAHLAKLDELFASLQYRAFRGEL